MQSKGVKKFCSKQFGCKKRLNLLIVNVLNGFHCIANFSKFYLIIKIDVCSLSRKMTSFRQSENV